MYLSWEVSLPALKKPTTPLNDAHHGGSFFLFKFGI